MTLSLLPERLRRCQDIARILYSYGRSGHVPRAGAGAVIRALQKVARAPGSRR